MTTETWRCDCGHSEYYHGIDGCASLNGHDEYCYCSNVPPAKLATQHTTTLLRLRCKTHPRYGALRKPRSACEACWELWLQAKKWLPNEE